MGRIWEEGETILVRNYTKEAMNGRYYVFDVIRRDPGPFLEMKSVTNGDDCKIYYRSEGTCSYEDHLRRKLCNGKLEIEPYLHLMYHVLAALEAAEERMVMSGSFVADPETIRYHEQSDSVRFMYVPSEAKRFESKTSFWTGEPAVEILLELLKAAEGIDPDFRIRWPALERTFLQWKEMNRGRNHCMKEIKAWLKEFPQT